MRRGMVTQKKGGKKKGGKKKGGGKTTGQQA